MNKKILYMIVAMVCLLTCISATAEERWCDVEGWRISFNDPASINLEVILLIEEAFGDMPFVKTAVHGNEPATLSEFIWDGFLPVGCSPIHVPHLYPDEYLKEHELPEAVEITTTFRVTVSSAINVRDCAGTDCNKVGQARPGDIYEVVAEAEDNWYEIRWGDSTAFIAGWLTKRLPDIVLETGQSPYQIPGTTCQISPQSSRDNRRWFFGFAISGTAKGGGVTVDLYRPDSATPMSVSDVLIKEFVGSDEAYEHQWYASNWLNPGLHTIELTRFGRTFTFGWTVEQSAQHHIYVHCD